jgi:hypothetical protein
MLVCFMLLLRLVRVAHGRGAPDQLQLLQVRTNASADIRTARPVQPANTDGVIFDFAEYGGAAAYLASLETRQVDSLLLQAGWSGGARELAKKLDSDPELVSVRL